jgi:hypothetical protein
MPSPVKNVSLTFATVGLALGALVAMSPPASANLIFLGTTPGSVPGGVGNSAIVLSLQSPGSSTTETGSVNPPGPTCAGDTQSPCGSPSNGTPSLSSAGVTSAADLRILLDAQEPGNDNLITANSLQLRVFNAAGTTLEFTANLSPTPIDLTVCPGQGNNCINIFGLDATEASALQNTAGFNTSWIAALSASMSDATGGPDRFFLSNAHVAVPEPASLAIFGAALTALGLLRRRRKNV